jgi:acetyl esterase
MPVDPFLEPFLVAPLQIPEVIDDYPAYRAMNQAASDASAAQLSEPGPEVKECREVSILVEGGTIDLLIYQPFEPGPHPAHMFLHGGGFVFGSIRNVLIDIICRERCIGTRCVVVSVDYRKAPEHKFPTPLNDCYAALTWVADHTEELGVRTSRITVGGQSAGGNLAAALALKARDEGGPHLAFQLLEVPGLDLTFGHLRREFSSGYALSLRDLELVRRDYLNSPEEATCPGCRQHSS